MNPAIRLIILVTFVLSWILVGCGASSESAPSMAVESYAGEPGQMQEMREMSADSAMPAEAPVYADGQSVPIEDFLSVAVAQNETRVIIYTGEMSLIVKDTEEAIAQITALADEQSGFVSGSNVYEAGEALQGSITIRVPAERYQDTLAKLRELALRVERENSASQDVTEEFTDLQARQTNLEFTEAALQELLDERQRVGSTSDILEVYRELTTIRGQIEQIEGRLRYLANQSALSTINIQLTPDIIYQPISVAGWQPQGVAREALEALIEALQGLASVAIWLVVFVLPLALVFLIPLAIVGVVMRGWWRRRQRGSQKTTKAAVKSPDKQEEKKP
jgi:hypothetical protein